MARRKFFVLTAAGSPPMWTLTGGADDRHPFLNRKQAEAFADERRPNYPEGNILVVAELDEEPTPVKRTNGKANTTVAATGSVTASSNTATANTANTATANTAS